MTTNIATTKEQSARLRQCGVDPKTADMYYQVPITLSQKQRGEDILLLKRPGKTLYNIDTPAWSLSALLAILPEKIKGGYWLTIQKCRTREDAPVYYCIAYFKCKWDTPKDISNSTIPTLSRLEYFRDRNLIEAVCKMIEWLTANNYKLNQL